MSGLLDGGKTSHEHAGAAHGPGDYHDQATVNVHGQPSGHVHDNHVAHHGPGHDGGKGETNGALKDPVCGMPVSVDSQFRSEHNGHQYFFCSDSCREKFRADPLNYVDRPTDTSVQAVPAGTMYTCPMHPEIRQDHPGNCPKCGMTLEPLLPSLEDEENPELTDFRRRFWLTLPLTAVVFILAMFGHRLGWMDAATNYVKY